MRQELKYFTIEGSYGGNQEWFTNVVMNIGGCAAATACDCCIYFALYKGLKELYPYNVHSLTIEEYVKFSQKMKPYIRPRMGGVRKLEWFMDGLERYIRDVEKNTDGSLGTGCAAGGNGGPADYAATVNRDVTMKMEGFPGERAYEDAADMIRRQIDAGYPVPYLLLRHKKAEKFKDYIWHWFLLAGYEEAGEDLLVKTATYGESDTFSLRELWDTGCEEKGGMIKFKLGTG